MIFIIYSQKTMVSVKLHRMRENFTSKKEIVNTSFFISVPRQNTCEIFLMLMNITHTYTYVPDLMLLLSAGPLSYIHQFHPTHFVPLSLNIYGKFQPQAQHLMPKINTFHKMCSEDHVFHPQVSDFICNHGIIPRDKLLLSILGPTKCQQPYV